MNNLKSPFICCVQKAIPLAYDESLSYYETLCALIKYIKDVVTPTTNDLIDKVQELESYVTNYFDNLDVQEEINNKLDEMAESGQLTDIIAQYLQLAGMLCYNTVSDMKTAENLTNGSIARTLGYYTVNDGGQAIYKITDSEDLTIHQEELQNGLYANLIEVKPTLKQLGAVADGITDDTNIVNKSINLYNNVIFNNGTYLCNVIISEDIDVAFTSENATIKSYDGNPVITILNNSISHKKLFKELYFELDNNEEAIKIMLPSFVDNYNPNMIEIKNINVLCENTFTGNCINLQYIRELNIENVYIKRKRGDDSARTGKGFNLLSCMNLNILNSSIGFFDKAISITNGTMSSEGIKITNCELFFNNYGLNCKSDENYAILDIRINDCMIDQIQNTGVLLDGVTSASITNNYFGSNIANSNSIKVASTDSENAFLTIQNNTIMHNLKSDSYPILIEPSNIVRNTIISNNQLINYLLNGIYLKDEIGNKIRNIEIIGNTMYTSSATPNYPINYENLPINNVISNNINNGSPYINSELNISNSINMYASNIITTLSKGVTVQNTSDRPLEIIINGYATDNSQDSRISIFAGITPSSLTEISYFKIYKDTNQNFTNSMTVIIPPKFYYAINPGLYADCTLFGILL